MAKKISQLESAVDVTANDLIQVIDVEDGDMAPSGTNKKATAQLLANELGKLTNVTATGSTTARSLANRFADVVNVKDFGAKGDGVTDDTAAIQAAIAQSITRQERSLYLPSGVYVVSSPITISGSKWTILGDSCETSIIKTTANNDILRIDLTVGPSNRGEIKNIGFDRFFTTPYDNSCGIRIVSNSSTGGLYAWKFNNLQFQHLYRCIRFGPTSKELWLGVPSIEKHSFCEFVNLKVLASTAFQPYECISFDEGCGPHHTINGGNLFATGAGSSCIKIGDGGQNNGFGDLLIYGVHITDSDTGIKLIGPSGSNIYNQNVTIAGCQFDGSAMTRTIDAIRMQNCRFFPNNSTSGGAVFLQSCNNIAYQTDENQYLFPQVVGGSTNRFSNGVTFGASGQYHATSGYVFDAVEWSNDTVGSIKMIAKSRGSTVGSHAAIQSGDRISEDRYLGSNGSEFVAAAQVVVDSAGTPAPSDTSIASKLEIRTSPGGTTSPIARIIADEAGNVAVGGSGVSTATTGTNGFVYVQKMLGAPTGTPAKTYGGRVPMVVDETNLRIYVYCSGSWRYAQLV